MLPVGKTKGSHHHYIQELELVLLPIFSLKLQFFVFFSKFAQKEYFQFEIKRSETLPLNSAYRN